MDVTDISEEAYDGAESPPDLTELESSDALLTGGPIRERLLDVITGSITRAIFMFTPLDSVVILEFRRGE